MRVGLLAACADRELFGFEPWPRQRRLLAAVEAGPRVQVWALGRRSGKSTMAGVCALHSCLFRPDLDAMVRPGELRYAVAVATNLAQARLIVRAARSIVERSPLLAPLVTGGDVDGIEFELPSGARTALRAFPCNSRGGRGWPVSTLILDEAAHFLSETEGDQTAERVWSALVPSTAQFGGAARIIVSSTPWGDGLFARLFQQASTGELADAAAHRATTAEMNPTIAPEFLAAEQARDPISFAVEYEARFEGSGAAYLDMERFEVAGRGELPPEAGTHWVAGLDPAFSSDPFGLAVVGRDAGDPGRLVLGSVRAWKPSRPASFEERRSVEDELLGEVIAVCRRYGASAVTDQYAARAVTERLARAGVLVRVNNMSAVTKTGAFGELRARLYDGTLALYPDAELLVELRRLRSKFTAGAAAVVNPRVGGSHGDRAQALALAVAEHARIGSAVTNGFRRGGRLNALSWRALGAERALDAERSGEPLTAGLLRALRQ